MVKDKLTEDIENMIAQFQSKIEKYEKAQEALEAILEKD